MVISKKIKKCDSTVYPLMGCGGCELWPTYSGIRNAFLTRLMNIKELRLNGRASELVDGTLRKSGDQSTGVYHQCRDMIKAMLVTLWDGIKPDPQSREFPLEWAQFSAETNKVNLENIPVTTLELKTI